MVTNRVELLLELIRRNGSEDIELFDILVPSKYGEFYSLYNILEQSGVLESCNFKSPSVSDSDILTVTMVLNKKDTKKCSNYIESIDFEVQYLKNDKFRLELYPKGKELSITFIPII